MKKPMTIERVNIDDVYPVEDEHGNQYLSRDYSLKENKKYIDELAASFDESGEPNEPPVLVRDGGIFRIKSGNTRIMAMRKLGTKSFDAVIDERDTPQSLVEAVIRTDTKKKYEPLEASRYEQQLYLFATDQYISKVTGRKVDEVKAARKTMMTIDDTTASDLTIERMIELNNWKDNKEVYNDILNAPEERWQEIAKAAYAREEQKRAMQEIEDKLLDMGLTKMDDCLDTTGFSYVNSIYSLKDVKKKYPEGSIFYGSGYSCFFVYKPYEETVLTPEEKAEQDLQAELKDLSDKAEEARKEWFYSNFKDIEDYSPIAKLSDKKPESLFDFGIDEHIEQIEGFSVPDEFWAIEAFFYLLDFHVCSARESWYSPSKFIALTDALVECGYKMPAFEKRLYKQAQADVELLKEESDE